MPKKRKHSKLTLPRWLSMTVDIVVTVTPAFVAVERLLTLFGLV